MSSARPPPRAAAHTGLPVAAATPTQAAVMPPSASGVISCLLIFPSLPGGGLPRPRLEVHRVERQGEPDEHTDHHEERELADEPAHPGADAGAGDHAARG